MLLVATLMNSCTLEPSKQLNDVASDHIRINQLGFYPKSAKQFVVADTLVAGFEVMDMKFNKVYEGKLSDKGIWKASGERVLMGDFHALKTPGTYYLVIDKKLKSHPFQITDGLYKEALQAAVKSYYFQRASMAIEETYGGIYKRAAGHYDMACSIHPGANSDLRSLDAPGGWYDAGDYGKYVGNASLSTGQMLLLLEQYPNVIPDKGLNIPESGNGISDLWDELRYELDWILRMQDKDGGVFHKLTARNFSGFVMPENYNLERLIIGKGTAATLNFSAVLAQASRLYKEINQEWAKKAITASERAWKWARTHESIAFNNPSDVVTGEYGDDYFQDDLYWAAAELFLATGKEKYLEYLQENGQLYQHQLTNSWKFFVRNNAFHSLLENADQLPDEYAHQLKQGHLHLADSILVAITSNPYGIALERFEWGSNSDILNQAVILCMAHRISGDEKYLEGAEKINDYIFGKNATAYCFLTGFGSERVMFPHHRPSGSDGIDDPVPGFIIGGPNHDRQDKNQVSYSSPYPAKAYEDVEESYASNEVCLNWNAPAVYVMGYLENNR